MGVEVYLGRNGYQFELAPAGQQLVFASEHTYFGGDIRRQPLGCGHTESEAPGARN